MTHFSAFSGIHGFTIAAGWNGFKTIGHSEIEPYCIKLSEQNFPDIPNYGDIRNTDAFSDLRGRVTVFSAGVPCQPASLAGKRRGASDDRWLWPSALSIVECVQPAWCIFENPIGILSLDEFSGILLRLESIGYQVRAFSVPANAVGAGHLRYRVFIVANAKGKQTAWQGSGGLQSKPSQCSGPIGDFRITEPPLCRRADGISNRSHRLKALGNSVVPQQVAPFFSAIAKVEIR